jgi:hypothetical protein
MRVFSVKRVADDGKFILKPVYITQKCQLLLCVKVCYCRCRNWYVVLSAITKAIEIQGPLTMNNYT